MHSHKCANPGCPGKVNGVPVIWHHSNKMRGNVEAHTCPVCGFAQWEQYEHKSQPLPGEFVDASLGFPPRAPVHKKSTQEIVVDIMYWTLVAAYVGLIGYSLYRMYRKGAFRLPEVSA